MQGLRGRFPCPTSTPLLPLARPRDQHCCWLPSQSLCVSDSTLAAPSSTPPPHYYSPPQDERLAACKAAGESHYYLMEIDANQVIDARHKSNLARFINHSCEPNAQLQRWSVDGFTRIGIFATQVRAALVAPAALLCSRSSGRCCNGRDSVLTALPAAYAEMPMASALLRRRCGLVSCFRGMAIPRLSSGLLPRLRPSPASPFILPLRRRLPPAEHQAWR